MLSKMQEKLMGISDKWEQDGAIELSDENQKRLTDFHLIRLVLTNKDRSVANV
jgi:hypothetical protein